MKTRAFDIRLSDAEAVVLLGLAHRLQTDEHLAAALNPAEHVVVTNLVELLDDALTPTATR